MTNRGGMNRFDPTKVAPFISASSPGEASAWRKGVATVSSAKTSWSRTPSAIDPSTTRHAARPTNPVKIVRDAARAGAPFRAGRGPVLVGSAGRRGSGP